MKPPAEDLERRRPVWEALSTIFLDTEICDAQVASIAEAVRSSGYTNDELESILWGELCPVLYVNAFSAAGEWQGFNMDYVEKRILTEPAGRIRRWLAYANGGNLVRHDWKRVKNAMVAQRPE